MKRTSTLIASAACLLMGAPLAIAQPQIIVGRSSGPVMFSPDSRAAGLHSSPLTPEEFETYIDILRLDEMTTGIARDMYEGLRTENAELSSSFSEEMMGLVKEIQESGDHSKLMELMPELQQKRKSATEALRDTFLGDLKLLLSDAQAARWPLVEQSRRRVRVQSTLGVSAANIDMIELVQNTLSTVPDEVTVQLDSYARSLDRMLLETIKLREARTSFFGLSFDVDEEMAEELREQSLKQRELSVSIRDLNDRTMRLVSAELDADAAESLQREFCLAGFPQVYTPSYTKKAIRAALVIDSLENDQRSQIQALQSRHTLAVAKLNNRWERTIRDSDEEAPSGMILPGPGGATVLVEIDEGFGGFDGDAELTNLQKARQARNERDEQTLTKLRALLSENQITQLPEKPKERSPFDPANLPAGASTVFLSPEESSGGGVVTELQILTPDQDEEPDPNE